MKGQQKRTLFFLQNNVLIYPKFQIRLVMLNLLIFLTYALSVVSVIFYQLSNVSEQLDLKVITNVLVIKVLVITIFFSLFSVMINLYHSFKFSYPLLKMIDYFNSVIQFKTLMPLQFRKGDYFQELPPLIMKAMLLMLNKNGEK